MSEPRCDRCGQPVYSPHCLCAQEAEIARLREGHEWLQLNSKFTCGVCWTSSYVPVPDETECNLDHPHEGEHARCDQCWIKELYVTLESRLAQAREFFGRIRLMAEHGSDAVAVLTVATDALRALEGPR